MKRFTRWLSAAVLAVGCSAQAADISDGEVRIGLLTDMHSIYAAVGRGSEIAAEMAIDDFGGEVLGEPVRLYTRDHKLSTEEAMKHAKALHEKENVDAFLDMIGTHIAIPMQRFTKENNIVALHTSSGAGILTGRECSPVGVHWIYDTYAMATSVANAVMDEGGETWFFIAQDTIFGQLLVRDAAAAVQKRGGKVVGMAKHPFKGTDFSMQLLQAQASGADVIGLATAGDDLNAVIRQAYELGMMDGDVTMAALMGGETIITSLGMYASGGLKLATAWNWQLNEETKAWSNRFRQRSGLIPSAFSAGVYSAVLHYLKAIQAAGTDDAKTVVEQMRKIPVNDIFAQNGKVRADGRMVHDMYLAEINKPSDVTHAEDYFNVLKVIPGDTAFAPIAETECPYLAKSE